VSSSYKFPTANLNSTILTSGVQVENVIRVYWQETNLPKFDPEYASILAKKLDLDFAPTATATAASVQATRSGLSTGAKAGIGVGVPIAAILMLCAAFVLYKPNIQKKNGKMTESVAAQNAQPELVQTRVS
jgi:hypothetical protein